MSKEVPVRVERDGFYIIEYYACCLCDSEVCESAPRFVSGEKTLCSNCMFSVTEGLAQTQGAGLGGGFVEMFFRQLLKDYYPHKRYNIPKVLRQKILKKYKHKCKSCGAIDKLEIDHIRPLSKGGSNRPSNLQVLCKSCNLIKGVKWK